MARLQRSLALVVLSVARIASAAPVTGRRPGRLRSWPHCRGSPERAREGTLLYATLLESIGIQPVLVFIPGHAFVAWKPSPADRTREPRLYLETTMTGSQYTFEEAMQAATRTFRKIAAERHFEIGDTG